MTYTKAAAAVIFAICITASPAFSQTQPGQRDFEQYTTSMTKLTSEIEEMDAEYGGVPESKKPELQKRLVDIYAYRKKAADAGYPPALSSLADDKLEDSPAEAAALYQKAAEKGHAPSMTTLGTIYLSGADGITADTKKSEYWLFKACALNDHDACQMLLDNYGEAFTVNDAGIKKAIEVFQAECDGGNLVTCRDLGAYYKRKNGLLAIEYYKKYSASGYGDASGSMWMIAEIYDEGLGGVPVDKTQAFKWYLKASEAGNRYTPGTVVYRLRNGIGVEKDEAKAAEWEKKMKR